MQNEPRAYTKEEVKEKFLRQIAALTEYWSTVDCSEKRKLSGLAFSILNIIDGTSSLPSFDLVLRPHEDDEEFCKAEGQNWFEDGMIINDAYLHEEIKEYEDPKIWKSDNE